MTFPSPSHAGADPMPPDSAWQASLAAGPRSEHSRETLVLPGSCAPPPLAALHAGFPAPPAPFQHDLDPPIARSLLAPLGQAGHSAGVPATAGLGSGPPRY